MRTIQRGLLLILLLSLASGCSILSRSETQDGLPTAGPTWIPPIEVTITTKMPAGTPSDAEIDFVILDEVSGWPYSQEPVPMKPLSDGRWQVVFTSSAGSLLRYRYQLSSPERIPEADIHGDPIQNRFLYLAESADLEDIVTTWEGQPYQGATGRILGRLVDATTGLPLRSAIASVAGLTTFTDAEGAFRLDGLVPGLHSLTALTPDGTYRPAQQGAIIAAESTTPAQMGLTSAKRVQITFEVTLPEDTLEGMPLRIAGNLMQLGHLFTSLPAGMTNAIDRMPMPIRVDPTHYIQILDLYAGTHFRYKYTLGDGLWNAERDARGRLFTRELVVPEHDLIIEDRVARWQGEDAISWLFKVTVPTETPPRDEISLQISPMAGFPGIPMQRIAEGEWFFTLYGLPDPATPLDYRYCRNAQCGLAPDSPIDGGDSSLRQIAPSSSLQEARDVVEGWIGWGQPNPPVPVSAPQVTTRPRFQVGVEIAPVYDATWGGHLEKGVLESAEFGSNAIVLTPSWIATTSSPFPRLEFDPAYALYPRQLIHLVSKARSAGLDVILHPSLQFPGLGRTAWWSSAMRDETWWSIWFERYRSFILYYAHIAAEAGVTKFVIGGPDVHPALPDGQLEDGQPSNAPSLAATQWQKLITEIKGVFPGKLAVEVDYGLSLRTTPELLSQADEVHVYWHAPLGEEGDLSYQAMKTSAREKLVNDLLAHPSLAAKPIVISVEYASVQGGASSCPTDESGSCAYAAGGGELSGEPMELDLLEQAEAISAVLAEALAETSVSGFFVRQYNPVLRLQDPSPSVNGKTALEVLKIWYPLVTGQ